jgi:hypothetical protein
MASRQPKALPPRARPRLVRELAPFVLLVCACGAAVREPGRAPEPVPRPQVTRTGLSALPPATLAAFDALAARAPSLAPGMREVARKETGTDAVDLAIAEGRDVCVRVAFEASTPVTVKLLDQGGHVLTATGGAMTEGVLAATGPVCVRKGDVVRGLAEGPDPRVRWMAWETP